MTTTAALSHNHAELEGKEGKGEKRDSRRGLWRPLLVGAHDFADEASTSGERV